VLNFKTAVSYFVIVAHSPGPYPAIVSIGFRKNKSMRAINFTPGVRTKLA